MTTDWTKRIFNNTKEAEVRIFPDCGSFQSTGSVILFPKHNFLLWAGNVRGGKGEATEARAQHFLSGDDSYAAFTYKLTLLSDVSRENALGI